MQAQTSQRSRGIWFFFIILISIATLISGVSGMQSPLGAIIGHRWAHFLLYLALGCIAFFAWRASTALIISCGAALVSVTLQIARAALAHAPLDVRALVVNLLGIVAGVLLGFNILTHRSNTLQQKLISSQRPPQQKI